VAAVAAVATAVAAVAADTNQWFAGPSSCDSK
jgi:hypothetical protein